jgi:signal transduction histidine kinase
MSEHVESMVDARMGGFMPPDLPPVSMPLAVLTRAAQFVAHDLRHHLSTVYANAEFLGGRRMKSVDKEELLREIRLAINCMTDQLDSLLLFTRTGHMMEPRRESLKSIVEHAIEMVRSHPETRNVTIGQQDIPALEGCMDGVRLCSAIYNLLLNACQAANAANSVRWVDVDLCQDSSYVSVQVSNGGPGVSPAIRETLFQPFVKAEGSKSMGLGLTIARSVAREHGGEAYLKESRPGRTVFVLTLPKALFRCLSTPQS